MTQFQHTITKPFNLTNAVKSHGWFQLVPHDWNDESGSLTWAMTSGQGKAISVSVTESGATTDQVTLSFTVHQDGINKDEVIRHFYYIMNLDLDLSGFYALCATHPVIHVVPDLGMGRLMRSASVFEDVFKSICGTNVQWRQAVKMINAIAELGTPVEGSEYRVFPTPQQVLDAGEAFLKDVGRVGYRSSYLIDLCERCLQPDDLYHRVMQERLPFKELFTFFNGFKGIGKVTARYLCAIYGRFDELSIDSLVISYMSRVYYNGEKATIPMVEEAFAKYGEWKYLVYWTEFMVNKGWDPDA